MVNETEAAVSALVPMFESRFGKCQRVEALPGAGSDRKYFRLCGEMGTAIGVVGPDVIENRCFVALAKYFHDNTLPVPKIYCCTDSCDAYLESDLGSVSLFSLLKTADARSLIYKCIDSLVRMQRLPREEWMDKVRENPFCARQIMWDLNYFKYEYLKPSGEVFDENALEEDFERLAHTLLDTPVEMLGFMYRDCQSRNVMVVEGSPYWIDFQGGRLGPCLYDAVSFLWQAKADFSSEFRDEVMTYYINRYSNGDEQLKRQMTVRVPLFVLFRTLQVLGAYGFRGLVQHRAHFIESIPLALTNLREQLRDGSLDNYPELKKVVTRLCADPRFVETPAQGLTVDVCSFSYKKGYPDNFSGNGGGFMFDCRGMHNPGRYDDYKPLTGLDEPVCRFLEDRGEVQKFLASAWDMTDASVECYLRRGFSSLQIGFGCTGGRHRSVYCAEATARHIKEKYPDANVIVTHREQYIKRKL